MQSIEILIKEESWKKARRLILKRLKAKPKSHWLWTTLGVTYYEEFQYEKALECDQKAMELAPQCPLVLWNYASSLDMHGLAKEALAGWKKILRRGVRAIAYGKCGEGIVSARGLVNDCNYRIAVCYAWLGHKALAVRYFEKYLENRKKGDRSIYNLRQVKKELAAIESLKMTGDLRERKG